MKQVIHSYQWHQGVWRMNDLFIMTWCVHVHKAYDVSITSTDMFIHTEHVMSLEWDQVTSDMFIRSHLEWDQVTSHSYVAWSMSHLHAPPAFQCDELCDILIQPLHFNESCHIWKRVVSRVDEARESWMRHVTRRRVMWHINRLCDTSHVTYQIDCVTYQQIKTWCDIPMHSCYHISMHSIPSSSSRSCISKKNSHASMSHVTCRWVMSHVHKSCPLSK